jgi:hypothetical protein
MHKKLNHLKYKYFPNLRPERIERRRRLKSKYSIVNRQNKTENLLILVCGYKSVLWEDFFARIASFVPSDMDVCIVCPGFSLHFQLEQIARENGYSILMCEANKLSVAQNIAILNHPKAQNIFKLDEDILITEHFIPGMLAMKKQFDETSKYEAGFYAPLININGYSYHRLLDLLNKSDEYQQRFGKIESKCIDIPAWNNGDAAQFLWEVIAPIDQTAARLYSEGKTYTVCPHRFSIGAMLFTRTMWEDINYFKDAPEGYLGLEEIQVAEYCARECKPIVVSEEVLVGHFSFGPQYEHMLAYLKDHPTMLQLKD